MNYKEALLAKIESLECEANRLMQADERYGYSQNTAAAFHSQLYVQARLLEEIGSMADEADDEVRKKASAAAEYIYELIMVP